MMDYSWVLVPAAALLAAAWLVSRRAARSAWRRRLDAAIRHWAGPAETRSARLAALLNGADTTTQPADRAPAPPADADPPDEAVLWILLGLARLEDGEVPAAARPFQIAYHMDPSYELVALLAFTCVKMASIKDQPLVQVLLETWADSRKPDIPSTRRERALLEALSAFETEGRDAAICPTGPLSRALCSLPVTSLCCEVVDALRHRPGWADPLLHP